MVRVFFTVDSEGWLKNKKADKVMAEAVAFLEAKRASGRAGAEKRWHSTPNCIPNGTPNGTPNGERYGETIASTPTSNTKEGGQKTDRPDMEFIITDGLDSLIAGGLNEREARAVLGRMVKEFGEADAAAALQASIGKADVKSYALAILTKKKRDAKAEKRFVI